MFLARVPRFLLTSAGTQPSNPGDSREGASRRGDHEGERKGRVFDNNDKDAPLRPRAAAQRKEKDGDPLPRRMSSTADGRSLDRDHFLDPPFFLDDEPTECTLPSHDLLFHMI